MDSKISIIVPIYNVEKYLENCINNLVNQTYTNLEIILVDDESPDGCPAICDKWAEKDSRIKVVHKKNAGLGMARNSGIDAMTGDYAMFVDSDDYLALNACERALCEIEKTGAEACFFCSADVIGEAVFHSKGFETFTAEGDEIIKSFLLNSIAPDEKHAVNPYPVGMSSCMAMYSGKFFYDNNLRFVSEREYINEDLVFRIELCSYLKKAVIIPDELYYYWHHSKSLTTSYKPDRFDKAVVMFQKTDEMLEKYNYPELKLRAVKVFLTNAMVCVKHEVFFEKQIGKKESKKHIKEFCSNKVLQDALCGYPINKMNFQQRLFFGAMKAKNAAFLILMIKSKQEVLRIKRKIKR